VALIERLAQVQRRDLSAIVDLAVEEYAKGHGVKLSERADSGDLANAETVDLVKAAAVG
jgi:hypothetical protein